MSVTIHERPGVYSSYDALSVVSGSGAGKTIGVAAVAAKGAANEPVLVTSYEEGLAAFGTDGVTPVEAVGGVVSPVRAVTTRTTTGGASDTTWRELTTILIVDDVIPTIRSSLRSRFARSKNTAQSRGAIRSQVILELEDKLASERIDSYGEVKVSAIESDPTACLVEFSFAVAHGLTRIYLTAHITV